MVLYNQLEFWFLDVFFFCFCRTVKAFHPSELLGLLEQTSYQKAEDMLMHMSRDGDFF